MKLSHKRLASAVLECVGIGVCSLGVGVELAKGADTYLVLITIGATIVAVGSMLWAKVKF